MTRFEHILTSSTLSRQKDVGQRLWPEALYCSGKDHNNESFIWTFPSLLATTLLAKKRKGRLWLLEKTRVSPLVSLKVRSINIQPCHGAFPLKSQTLLGRKCRSHLSASIGVSRGTGGFGGCGGFPRFPTEDYDKEDSINRGTYNVVWNSWKNNTGKCTRKRT